MTVLSDIRKPERAMGMRTGFVDVRCEKKGSFPLTPALSPRERENGRQRNVLLDSPE
jgi:hypothetical protein